MAERPWIFFHSHSDDATIDAVRTAQRREPKVILSHTLIREIRVVLGIAHPRDPTVLLLWPKYKKKRPRRATLAERAVLAAGSLALLFAAAVLVAHG